MNNWVQREINTAWALGGVYAHYYVLSREDGWWVVSLGRTRRRRREGGHERPMIQDTKYPRTLYTTKYIILVHIHMEVIMTATFGTHAQLSPAEKTNLEYRWVRQFSFCWTYVIRSMHASSRVYCRIMRHLDPSVFISDMKVWPEHRMMTWFIIRYSYNEQALMYDTIIHKTNNSWPRRRKWIDQWKISLERCENKE